MKETRKTIHDRVWDEESKDYVWKDVEIVRYRHDEEDRALAVLDFLKKEQKYRVIKKTLKAPKSSQSEVYTVV